jgi:C-terminal processing protease CtpA/Prc
MECWDCWIDIILRLSKKQIAQEKMIIKTAKMKILLLTISIFAVLNFVQGQNQTELASADTSTKIEYLKTFAKVYGYVKYFHPSDEAAKVDWDKFAIYGSEKIQNCKNQEELFYTLNELFNPLAPTLKFYKTGEQINFDIHSITPPHTNDFKITYWQHNGISKNMNYRDGNCYESARINRTTIIENKPLTSSDFGILETHFSAENFRGKKIKFTAMCKLTNDSKGTGHLWLRIDKPNKEVGFFNNMNDNPIIQNSWEKYEIVGEVDLFATDINLGCFLQGDGELLIDDLKLYYFENDKWIEIPLGNSNFDGKKINFSPYRLTWTTAGEGYEITRSPLKSFDGSKCTSVKKNNADVTQNGKKIFKDEPAIGEVINKNIGSGISCRIPLVLYCNNSGTFPAAKKNNLDSILKSINSSDLSLALRLADIIITWNVFQHFYPYFDVTEVNWNLELEKALRSSYYCENRIDFLYTLQQFTAPLKDGHIWVSGGGQKLYTPSITWEFVENKLIITKVCDSLLNLKVGNIVTAINGISSEKYFDVIKSRISAATDGWLNYRANTMSLSGQKDSKIFITVSDSIIELTRNIELYSINCDNSISASNIKFKKLDNNIVYLNLELIEMQTIDSLLPQLTNAKSIICDLRGYPNGNHEMISYLLQNNDTAYWMFIPQFIYPDQEKIAGYQKFGWQMKVKKPHIKAKIIFLVDGSAISYAESYMGYIEGYKLATIVGQPTAGTNGNMNSFSLPGGYRISFTGMKVLKHDGSQLHGLGILPNIFVSKTIKGVIEGKDEFLEKAIEIANENK